MKKIGSTHFRILAIAPSSKGFGFALLEEPEKLIDWGVKSIQGDKNIGSIVRIKEMILHYQPGVIVLEDALSEVSRRSVRIQKLSKEIVALAKSLKIRMALLSQPQVRKAFFVEGLGTKDALAEILAARFSEELASRLPPKRRPWMSEDYRMGIFDAVALALALQLKRGGSLELQVTNIRT